MGENNPVMNEQKSPDYYSICRNYKTSSKCLNAEENCTWTPGKGCTYENWE